MCLKIINNDLIKDKKKITELFMCLFSVMIWIILFVLQNKLNIIIDLIWRAVLCCVNNYNMIDVHNS
jgi:hypothetical protein